MRDNVPCWDICGGWPGKPRLYGGLYDPRLFMDFIPHAAAQFAGSRDDDKFYYETDFYPGAENSCISLPLYRLVEVDEEHNPVPGEPVEECDFEMRESTVGRLWEFQKVVNAVQYKMGFRTAMAQSGHIDKMFRLAGEAGDPEVLAKHLANTFKMEGSSTVADLWAHVATALDRACDIREVVGKLHTALARTSDAAAGAYSKLGTETPPFPERFYRTLGNQLVEAAVVIKAFNRLTRGSAAGSVEPFHLLGPLEQLRIGVVNMEALGE